MKERRKNPTCNDCGVKLASHYALFCTKHVRIGSRNSFFGKKHTESSRNKISLVQVGKKVSEETKSKMSLSQKGLVHSKGWMPSLEWRRKQSMAQAGTHNSNWKGGLTSINRVIRASLDYKLWRTAVFERDNYTCVLCGSNTSGTLNADHIKPFAYFPELRFSLKNGRTLCVSCHRQTETWGVHKQKQYICQ